MPVFTGFVIKGSSVETGFVHAVPQWLYLLMEAGLIWVSAMTVALLALMVSVLVRKDVREYRNDDGGCHFWNDPIEHDFFLAQRKIYLLCQSTADGLFRWLTSSDYGYDAWLFASHFGLLGIASLAVSFSVFTKQDILN